MDDYFYLFMSYLAQCVLSGLRSCYKPLEAAGVGEYLCSMTMLDVMDFGSICSAGPMQESAAARYGRTWGFISDT